MIIKKLELQGFKSFPERTKIFFHPGITVIVGPNGTGKSNIVDGLLWVLGGKRMRSLRGERSTEIIFNGSQKSASMSMADVILSLADETEELKINHRYYRSGESEYRMNGKVVRLKDIQESLWKKSIGEKEYFVIEQGAVGLFLSSKPIEKRLLLEEAAGTAYYKDKKRQAQNKLENSEENLIRLEDIIAEVSKAKNSLKRQASAAIRYKKLREEIRRLTSFHYRKRIEDLGNQQADAVSHYTQSLNKENQAFLRLKNDEQNLAAKRKDVWILEKSNKQEQEKIYGLKAQISQSESEVDKEKRRIEFFEEKKSNSEQNRKELEQELITLEKEQKDVEKLLKTFHVDLRQNQKDLEKANEAKRSIREQLDLQQKKIEDLREDHLKSLAEHTEIKNDRAKIEKEFELLIRQEEKLKSQLREASRLEQQKQKTFDQVKQDLTQIRQLSGEKMTLLNTIQTELSDCQTSIDQIQTQIAKLENDKEKVHHQLHSLEKVEETERARSLPGEVEGTLGILADLIESDEAHSSLIDVLWKEETKASLIEAREFIQYLTDKGVKGNFLLLHPEVKKATIPEVNKDPRAMGHLKSYLQPDRHIRDRLSYLQDAVIVQDIRIAVELWIENPSTNYVTLSGDVLFSSGLIKAGDQKEGLLTLRKEKEKLKKKIGRLDSEIAPLNRQIEEKQDFKNDLEKRSQSISSQLEDLKRKIEASETTNLIEKTEREKIAANIAILKKELEILGEDRKNLEKNLQLLSSGTKKIEKEEGERTQIIQEEEDALIALRKEEEQRRSQYFELKSNTDLLKERFNNLQVQAQNLQKRKKTIQDKMDSLDKDIQNSDREKDKIRVNIQNFSKQFNELRKELEEKENQLVQDEMRLKEMQDLEKEMETEVDRLKEIAESRKEERIKWEIKKAERDRDLANLEESCWQELKKTLQEIKDEIPMENLPQKDTEALLDNAREQLQKFKAVNLMAEEEYKIHKERYDFLIKERKDLHESISSTKEAIKKIDQESKNQFMKALQEVNKNFQHVFSLLFEGGHAEVKLTDPSQLLESGVDIIAQPPGKRVQSLNLLSGGERALTSLAFFFALFRYKPTPFCVLDEVDAALDEVNLGRFLNLMKKVKEQTQFILITHNFKTMEVADYIYGTTMAEPNVTNLYSMKIDKKDAH
jgi:chromosome segregation protein